MTVPIARGSWVTQIKGTKAGRTGVIVSDRDGKERPLVKFGPGGPFNRVRWGQIVAATPHEISRAGWTHQEEQHA